MGKELLTLPNRPRLADFAWARQHIVDGRELVLIHDQRNGEAIEIEPRQFQLLAAADGSRDLDRIMLAASRAGALRRSSELHALLGQLHERGLLADGILPSEAVGASSSAKPVLTLPNYRFVCDANGSCCRTYGSVRFNRREAERARVLVPEVLDGALRAAGSAPGPRPANVFLPLQGSKHDECACTMIDGQCCYLDDRGYCRIQQRGDGLAKPLGCRSFPATFVDEGESIVVSAAVECPCVLTSIGSGDGDGLVGEQVHCEADLESGLHIIRLPEAVQVTSDHEVSLAELRTWTAAVLDGATPSLDTVAAFWSLAAAVDSHGLDPAAAQRALRKPRLPGSTELGPWLAALRAVTDDRNQGAQKWRSQHDRARSLHGWIAHAAAELVVTEKLESCLVQAPSYGDHESFYFRATLYGRHLAAYEAPLEPALRDRAVRLLLARQLGSLIDTNWRQDPAANYPLTVVEAMMRGHGLWAYVNEVVSE